MNLNFLLFLAAVELYVKFDKSACSVVRELGYPNTKMLRLWYHEYFEEGDLHKKPRLQSGYTSEQRAAAVKYYQEHDKQHFTVTRMHEYLTVKLGHKELEHSYHLVRRYMKSYRNDLKREYDSPGSMKLV